MNLNFNLPPGCDPRDISRGGDGCPVCGEPNECDCDPESEESPYEDIKTKHAEEKAEHEADLERGQ